MQPISPGYPVEQLLLVILNWGLFGALSVQLYMYYLAFPKEKQFIKYFVYGVYIVELFQTILISHDAFAVFGYGFGDLEALEGVHFDWLSVPTLTAIVAFVGQSFYAYRIFILSKSRIVPAFIICMSLTSSVAAITTGVYYFQADNLNEVDSRKISTSIEISCGGYALCDIVIAICMTYYLMRANTGFRRTQILVTKLIRLIIETGTLTAVVALSILILFVAFPHHGVYGTLTLIISKLYANNIYTLLNSRIRISGGREAYTSSTDMEVTSTMIRDIPFHLTQDPQRIPVVAIHKEVSSSDDGLGGMKEKPQDGDMSFLA